MQKRMIAFAVMALVCGAGLISAQPGGGRVGTDYRRTIELNSGYALIVDPAVAKELNLSDEQVTQLKKLPDDILAKHKTKIDEATEATKKTQEKRAAEAPALAKEMDQKVEELLKKHLTAEQLKRSRQLELQSLGTAAFLRKEVAEELKLTDDQKAAANKATEELTTELAKISADNRAQLGNAFPPVGEAQTKVMDMRRAAGRKAVASYVKTLTPEQAEQWSKIAGEPSDKINVITQRATTREGFGASPFVLTSQRTQLWLSLSTPVGIRGTAHWTDELKLPEAKRNELSQELMALQRTGSTTFAPSSFALSQTLSTEAGTAAEKVLKPEQLVRLNQIRTQLRGLAAFNDLELLKKLKFTPEQSATIEKGTSKVNTEWNKKFAEEAKAAGRGDARIDNFKSTNQLMADIHAVVMAALNNDQKAVCEAQFGKPFDRTALGGTTALRGGFGGPVGAFGGLGVTSGWSPANAWQNVAQNLDRSGKYADSKAAYEESLKLNPDAPTAQRAFAWQLATCPDDKVRDGKKAVELALKACEKDEYKSYLFVSTLAVAYAEVGKFDDAVKQQEKCVALLKAPPAAAAGGRGRTSFPPAMIRDHEARIKQFQENKPFRQEPLPLRSRPAQPGS